MQIIDHDLLSVQEARILSENAKEAQKALALFTQEQLDVIVEKMAEAIKDNSLLLAKSSHEETQYGNWQDKLIKNRFVSEFLPQKLKTMRCVGVINRDIVNKITDVGVPVGVIANICCDTSPVSSTVNAALIAVKSGNAIVFSPHPKAEKSIAKAIDIMFLAAQKCGLPDNAISYMRTLTHAGTIELMNSKHISVILNSNMPHLLKDAYKTGKPVIYGGAGNGPVFIERSAHIKQAVSDIIKSKTFDNGIVSASEQGIVVDAYVAKEVKSELQSSGAYFMTQDEENRLASIIYHADGRLQASAIGRSAKELCDMAQIKPPEHVKVLISQQKYVSPQNPYTREKFCPVMAFYVEDDWQNACEKCIELLLSEREGHTLVIHSNDENVIEQFALKKPVARMLVNTPSTLGSMGITTNLFPSMILGSAAACEGITTDNVSPMNLVYIRKIGYGVRNINEMNIAQVNSSNNNANDTLSQENIDSLEKVLLEFLRALQK